MYIRFSRRAVAVALVLVTVLPCAEIASAASSWNPTLIVNTEAFQTIDAGDGSSAIEFRFGNTGNQRLFWDLGTSKFIFTKPVFVQGNITGSGSLNMSGSLVTNTNITLNSDNGAADAVLTFGNATASRALTFNNSRQRFIFSTNVSVTGTASGRVLHAQDKLQSSGSLVVRSATEQPLLFADTLTNQVGIGTAIPKTTLEVVGIMSGSMLSVSNLQASGAVLATNGTTVVSTARGSSGQLLLSQGAAVPVWGSPTTSLVWYIDSDLEAAAGQAAIVTIPWGFTAQSVTLRAKTAPTGADLIVNIKKDGSTIFATKPQINDGSTTGGGGAAFSVTDIGPGSELSIDIDQVGSSVAGANLTIMLNGIRKY